MKTNEIPPPQQMFQHITAYWVTQLMAAAARLGVADQLDSGPLQVNELADKVGAHPASALPSSTRMHGGRSPSASNPARSSPTNPLSQDALLERPPDRCGTSPSPRPRRGHWRPWELLTQVVKTGKSSAREALGCELWDWYGSHAEESAAFKRRDGQSCRAGRRGSDSGDSTFPAWVGWSTRRVAPAAHWSAPCCARFPRRKACSSIWRTSSGP